MKFSSKCSFCSSLWKYLLTLLRCHWIASPNCVRFTVVGALRVFWGSIEGLLREHWGFVEGALRVHCACTCDCNVFMWYCFTVDELSQLVENSLSALEDCVVLANKLNASLPEEERLDTFHVQTTSWHVFSLYVCTYILLLVYSGTLLIQTPELRTSLYYGHI
jgi:hypothetical protein